MDAANFLKEIHHAPEVLVGWLFHIRKDFVDDSRYAGHVPGALGSGTVMTLNMYARRKKMKLD